MFLGNCHLFSKISQHTVVINSWKILRVCTSFLFSFCFSTVGLLERWKKKKKSYSYQQYFSLFGLADRPKWKGISLSLKCFDQNRQECKLRLETQLLKADEKRYLDYWSQSLLWSSETSIECCNSLNNHILQCIKIQGCSHPGGALHLLSVRSMICQKCKIKCLHTKRGQKHFLNDSWIKVLLNFHFHNQESIFYCTRKMSEQFRSNGPRKKVRISSLHKSITTRETWIFINWCIS